MTTDFQKIIIADDARLTSEMLEELRDCSHDWCSFGDGLDRFRMPYRDVDHPKNFDPNASVVHMHYLTSIREHPKAPDWKAPSR